jgi:hypothetical protein
MRDIFRTTGALGSMLHYRDTSQAHYWQPRSAIFHRATGCLSHGGRLAMAEHCKLSERSAQLRMARNRDLIEAKFADDVEDLTLNQAAGLMMLTAKPSD